MVHKKVYRKRKVCSKPKKSMLSRRQIASIAKKAIYKQAETKMKSTETDAVAIGADDQSYVINTLSTVAQGSDNENRIGDSILQTGIQFKYCITMSQVSYANPVAVRVVFYKSDKDVFNSTSANFLVSTANEPVAPTANDNLDIVRSLNRKQLNRILYDKTHMIGSSNTGLQKGPVAVYRTVFKKLYNKKVYFPNDASTESEHDNIRCLVIVRDAAGGTATAGQADIDFTLMTRFYYKDF